MTEVSRNLRNIFFRKIPPILKLEVGFFSDRKSFSQIFQNTEDLYAVNFIWQNFEQNQRTFLEPIHHHPPSTTIRPSQWIAWNPVAGAKTAAYWKRKKTATRLEPGPLGDFVMWLVTERTKTKEKQTEKEKEKKMKTS